LGSRGRPGKLWIWIPAAILILAVSGYAVQRSVTIRADWKVLPYQTLRMSDSQEEIGAVVLALPEPTPLDYARGYLEVEHALRPHVVSNTRWTIQVRVLELGNALPLTLQARSHGGAYFPLSTQPQILATGLNGAFEISIDYRLPLGTDGEFSTDVPQEIVYTMMSD
jgi:hypothetical protein